MHLRFVIIGTSVLLFAVSSPALACYAPWRPRGIAPSDSSYVWERALLDKADVVLRVRALREIPARPAPEPGQPPEPWPPTDIAFEVLEVLKGDRPRQDVRVPGVAVRHDEFNPGRVPYAGVRPSGLAGACFT